MELLSEDEIVAAANFQLAIFRNRNGVKAVETPPPPAADTPPTPAITVGVTTPAPVETPPAGKLELVKYTGTDPVEVEAAFRAFLTRNGAPAGRALLDKYGAARLGDVKTEQLVAFLAEVTA